MNEIEKYHNLIYDNMSTLHGDEEELPLKIQKFEYKKGKILSSNFQTNENS